MGLVNQYGTLTRGMFTSGATLPDLKGSANGTMAGTATAPVANANGYIRFTGGNGATTGDRGRVEISPKTSFQYTPANSYSIVTIARSNKNDANTHVIFTYRDQSSALGSLMRFFNATENATIQDVGVTSGFKAGSTATNDCNNNWIIIITTYNGTNSKMWVNGKPITLALDEVIVGNFYTANAKVLMGALFQNSGATYSLDLTGDISFVSNANIAYSPSQIADISNEHTLLI